MNTATEIPVKEALGYSRLVGCVYIFNLIVGTGALTLPKAFQEAGWLLSGMVLTFLCLLSYITTTFVIESMSISNALLKLSKLKYTFTNTPGFMSNDEDDESTKTLFTFKRNYGSVRDDEQSVASVESLISQTDQINPEGSYFEIRDVVEMGQMAIMYFNKVGLILFYLSMCIYLYGDLAIYAAAVPTTIRDLSCTYQKNITENSSSFVVNVLPLADDDLCWPDSDISRINAYRIFLTGFVVLLCPFIFFNLTKTKLIQFLTVSMRWLAFGIMFTLMSIYLAKGNIHVHPKLANFQNTPNLLGICIYSFMCHHSLPSLVTPIKKKSKIYLLFLMNFLIILTFYLILSFLSAFSFKNIQSLITLNFQPMEDGQQPQVTKVAFFQYYLSLFPVFAISASFPIIGITLRNNLKNLISCGTGRKFNSRFIEKTFYPLLAIIPPIIVAYATNNITFLVGFTGSYAGTFIQYVIPISLVFFARRNAKVFMEKFREHSVDYLDVTENQLFQPYQSPFKHLIWCILILIWSVISIVFVTIYHIMSKSV